MKDSKNTLVNAFTTSSLQEAHIVRTLLGSKGINSYVFDENITSTIGTAFVEGYKLKVNSIHFEKAKKIIDDYKQKR